MIMAFAPYVMPQWSLVMKTRKGGGSLLPRSRRPVPQWSLVMKTRKGFEARTCIDKAISPQWSLVMKTRKGRDQGGSLDHVAPAAMEPGHEDQERATSAA